VLAAAEEAQCAEDASPASASSASASYHESVAKKSAAVFKPKELGEEAAKHLAAKKGAVEALHQAGTIGPYKRWAEFTAGKGSQYQAHHIVEKRWFEEGLLKGDPDLVPSVILTDSEHKYWNQQLPIDTKGVKTLEDLWEAYKKAYADFPEWLAAIRSYFPNAK